MENMIDPWLHDLRKERRERVRIVKKFLGIKPGDGNICAITVPTQCSMDKVTTCIT